MEQLLQENQIRDLKEFNSILYGIRNPSSEQGNSGQIIKIINGIISIEYEFSEYLQLFSLCNFQSNLYTSSSGKIYKSTGTNTTSWTEVFNFNTYECEIKSLIVFNNEIYAALQIIENGEYQGRIYKSSNGTVWSEVYSDSISPIFSLFIFDSKIYAGSKNKILRSSNGISWTEIYSGTGDIYTFGGYAGEIFAGLSNPSKIIRSLTGDNGTWTTEYTPPSTNYTLTMVSSAGKLFVGTVGYIFAYDGVIWESIVLTEIAAVSSILFGTTLYFGTYNNGVLIESDGESFIFEKKVEIAAPESVNIISSILKFLNKLFPETLEITEELISKAIYKRFENEDVNIEETVKYIKSFTKIAEPSTLYFLEQEETIKIDVTGPTPQSLVKIPKSEKVFIPEGKGYRRLGFYEEWISENETSYSILRKYPNQLGGYNYIGLAGETIYVFADSEDGIYHKKKIEFLFNDGQILITEGEVEGNARDNRQNLDKVEIGEGLMIKMPNMRSFENINISEHVRIIRESQYSRGVYDSNDGRFIVAIHIPPETVNIEDSGCVLQWIPSFIVKTGYWATGGLHTETHLVKGGREGASPAMGYDALGPYHKHDWLGNEIWEYPNPNYNPDIPGSPPKLETIWNITPWRSRGKSCWDKNGNISGEIVVSNVPIKVSIFDFFGKFVLFSTVVIVKDTINLIENIIKKGGWYYKVINEDVEIPEARNAFREHIKKVLDEIVVNIVSGVTTVKGFVRVAKPEIVWFLEKRSLVGIPTTVEYGDDYFLIFEESFAYINNFDINGNPIGRVTIKGDDIGRYESKVRYDDVWIKEMPGDIGWYVLGKIQEISSTIEISSSAIWNFFLKEIVSSVVSIFSEVKEKFESILIIKIIEPIILEIYSEALNKKKIKEILEEIVNIISEALNKKKIKEILEDIINIFSEGFYIKNIKKILENVLEIYSSVGYIRAIKQIVESILNIQESLLKFAGFIRVINENVKIFSIASFAQKTYNTIKEKGRMFLYDTKKFFVYQTSKFRLRK